MLEHHIFKINTPIGDLRVSEPPQASPPNSLKESTAWMWVVEGIRSNAAIISGARMTFMSHFTPLTTCLGSEYERGLESSSGLTGPVSCWARRACLTNSAWFWGSFGFGGGRTGFGDKTGGTSFLEISCDGGFGFHPLLFFLSTTGLGSGGFSWFSKKFLRRNERYS